MFARLALQISMTKNNWLLTLLAAVLFVVYAVYFTDWFKPKTIQIFSTYRNLHPRATRDGVLPALIFGVDRQIRLSDLRVVPFDGFQTNKNILPLWHLVTDSNSIPVKTFYYGQYIRGMHSAIKGTHSESLETNVAYLIIVTSDRIKGQHKFELK
jgi:hypothetical protein